jgi:hypothetical protein
MIALEEPNSLSIFILYVTRTHRPRQYSENRTASTQKYIAA